MKDQSILRGLRLKAFVGLVALGLVSLGAQAATVTVTAAGSGDATPGQNIVVAPGETFSVDILGGADFATGLLGWGLDFGFDGGLLTANGSTVDSGFWTFSTTDGTIGANDITLITGTEFSEPSGPFTFATVTFTAGLVAGVSMLSLVENASNPFSTLTGPYPGLVFDQAATITVAAVPVPAAVWMFGSALGLLGFMRRRMHKA